MGARPAFGAPTSSARWLRDAQAESLVVDSGERVTAEAIDLMEAQLPDIDADDPLRDAIERTVAIGRRGLA